MISNEVKKKKIFIDGPIQSAFIGESIAKHQTKTTIGAHNIFLGQVRNDQIDGKEVVAIEYTAYQEMAEKEIHRIREKAFEKFDLVCLHIYHSLGIVKAGEVCLFVFVSSAHRDASYQASRFIVEELKLNAPIFGKEIFEDDSHQWKVNLY
ncbi:MAG: molybdenum cofactor biosynthesis protein MoaE [Bacteroidetes bacterium]|nr:MAG: molybdenum cofactor biosynthesis protein MoaE [Bacteroidota bacterium]MBL1145782.1 molybdenum cofactor biosynthesis protein MoaE [Bacteroidota bacterium]MCB0803114.1 molybdenum cofactor biosynthesis protein MoaE [Flavobacteriales bacterium]NOG58576.1 molybdenum cofactor biosynthesis protein MoaE [Bacteroidota bacterium]